MKLDEEYKKNLALLMRIVLAGLAILTTTIVAYLMSQVS